ncbi:MULTISPECIES: hypothetical protein [Flammeovirga]|uniref:Uncharacterized protein n=1 Tax=Flammeovirga agarivorans TaxID=2726742 RepID=A0A7X8SPV1_9BACT|nr:MULTISPECIES: hypothetical protein [Flammeovirga]NLR94183.1 hypothetical protein [Flammeovirga agarivorans]
MKLQLSYKKIIRPLLTIWVALHTLNYSVDIDAVLVSQANYSPETLIVQDDKIESFVELICQIIFEDNFSDFNDNPFSQNESKSFSPIVCLSYPVFDIIHEGIEREFHESITHTFYLDKNYPTPIKDIVPPPPRMS